MTAFVDKMKSVLEQLEALKGDVRQELAAVGAEWLNSADNTKGYDVVLFGGYTPSFNDGDACEFTMSDIGGIKFEGLTDPQFQEDLEEEQSELLERDEDEGDLATCIDEISDPGEAESLQGRGSKENPFVEAVNLVEGTGLLERVFETTGFIFIVDKEGNFYDKEYDCGW